MAEWEPSEVEKKQAKVRLVRLDAEGNPVDGSVQVFRVSKLLYPQPETIDVSLRELLKFKRISFTGNFDNLDPETVKLLRGEDGDSDPAGDSDPDTAGR